ncbi:MAG: hypothetical protein K9K81_03130 [Desulfobacteraceae bacterium]|nr:hypothetical protein [Desulfobacteraceae bacterium]
MHTPLNYRPQKTRIIVLLFLYLVIVSAGSGPAYGELGPESFCRLHIKIMEATLSMLNNQITADEHEDALNSLYEEYGTTEDEYLLFMGGNGSETQAYIEANPELQKRINTLAGRLDSAMEAEQEENN